MNKYACAAASELQFIEYKHKSFQQNIILNMISIIDRKILKSKNKRKIKRCALHIQYMNMKVLKIE